MNVSDHLEITPIRYDEAYAFVLRHHRHNQPPCGWMFGCAVAKGSEIVGVIMIARPINRILAQDPYTLECTRCCCIEGNKNAASKLYGAAWRATRALGYRRLITYTRIDEPGTSLVAAGFHVLYETKAQSWNRPSRPRVDKTELVQRKLWERSDCEAVTL